MKNGNLFVKYKRVLQVRDTLGTKVSGTDSKTAL
jgi:hypothetical protein